IKATPRTIADMDRIHGPKEEKPAPAPKPAAPAAADAATAPKPAAPETEPAKTMAGAVPGNTGGERSAGLAEQELPPARVSMPEEGAGSAPEPGAPPG